MENIFYACLHVTMFFLSANAQFSLMTNEPYATRDKEFILTCHIGVSTTAKVLRWTRNYLGVVNIQISNCYMGDSGSGLSGSYRFNCSLVNRNYNVIIPAPRINNEAGSVWKCEDFAGGGSSNVYTLEFYSAPTTGPSITGYDGSPRFPGNSVVFACTINGGTPLATISWTCKGIQVQGTSDDTATSAISRYTVTIDTSYNGQQCNCIASHQQWTGDQTTQSPIFVVQYPPTTTPVVSGYDGKVLYQGDTITLKCQVSGGSPLATLSWTCKGQLQSVTASISGTTVTSVLTATMTAWHNGKTCICHGRHSDPTYTPNVSSRTFLVYYPPTTPTLQTSGASFPWVEKTQGLLKCITTPGNPPQTTYDWIQNSQVISGQTSDALIIPILTSDYNGLHIQCRVSNGYTVQRPPAKISDITELNVLYTPIISLDTTAIIVQEGESLSRPCSAIGNPTPTVKWYRTNNEQTSGTGTSATLLINDIDRSQAGTYTCKSTSTGKQNFESSKSVSVIVYYPPVITISLQNTTENATNIILTCNADGFPTNYTYHGWTQYIGTTVVRRYKEFTELLSESKRKITFTKVKFEDAGYYQCDAENGIQGRQPVVLQRGSSYFDIRASAKFDPNEEHRKPGDLGKNFTINIKFYSNPPALSRDIKWINSTNGNQLTNFGSISLSFTSTQIQRRFYGKTVTLNGQLAMLSISPLKSYHLGHYKLIIQNGGILTTSFDFEIIESAPPDAPLRFTVVGNKSHSVILNWEKGFHGGHPQTFVIRYTDTVTGETQEQMIEDTSQTSNYTTEIKGLKSGTTYLFWIYSTNTKGNSSFAVKPIIAHTLKEPEHESPAKSGAVIGGVVGTVLTVMFIALVTTVFFICRRRNNQKENEDSREVKPNHKYEDIDNSLKMSEINTYQTLRNTDNASAVCVSNVNTYDNLCITEEEAEANAYETLNEKDSDDIPAEKAYVNTTIG